jgi:hypothetical protein
VQLQRASGGEAWVDPVWTARGGVGGAAVHLERRELVQVQGLAAGNTEIGKEEGRGERTRLSKNQEQYSLSITIRINDIASI